MAFKSGRTEEQGMRPFIIEGGKLYVPPKRFADAKAEFAHPRHYDLRAAERAMLKTLGFMDAEIDQFVTTRHPGFEVVVDHDLKP